MIALAAAAAFCLAAADAYAMLTDELGERRIAAGLGGGDVIELWGDPESGRWTLLITGATGGTCIVGAGEALVLTPEEPEGDPA